MPPTIHPALDRYDDIFFSSKPSPVRHPDRLAVLAQITGIQKGGISLPRILELGCSTGANLLAVACSIPGAICIGIDRSPAQIEVARKAAADIGSSNVSFECVDLRDIGPDLGSFDFILCHGLYSWVPEDVRVKLLSVIQERLNPDGAASVSFNTAPGWSLRGSISEWLRSFPDALTPGGVLRARERLSLLRQAQIDDYSPKGILLREELDQLIEQSEAFFIHEVFNPETKAFSITEFSQRVSSAGLRYVADGDSNALLFLSASELGLEGEALERFAGMTSEGMRQGFSDLIHPRSIRTAILCHADGPAPKINREVIKSFFIAAPVTQPELPVDVHDGTAAVFGVGRKGSVEIFEAIQKAALMVLAEEWPRPISFTQFARSVEGKLLGSGRAPQEASEAHIERLIDLVFPWFAKDQVELTSLAPAFQCSVPERPHAHPFARLQSRTQTWVCNYRHEYVVLHEVEMRILELLDGARTRTEITDAVRDLVRSGGILLQLPDEEVERYGGQDAMISQLVEESLEKFAQLALVAKA